MSLTVPAGGGSDAASRNTVLLVDDDAAIRRFAKRALERLGYHVLECADAASALDTCTHYPGDIHLLLSDIVMPTMDGQVLARRIRETRPGIATLFMSGYGTTGTNGPSEDAGAHHLIQKPFGIDGMAAAVRDALTRRGAA